MTDNDIIKALECCSWDDIKECEVCPYDEKETNTYCANYLIKDAFDLITRLKAQNKEFDEKIVMQMGLIEYQKSEIEENNLKIDHQAQIIRTLETALADKMAEIERYEKKIAQATKILERTCLEVKETKLLVDNDIKKAKTEAIKEFADRLKEENNNRGWFCGIFNNDIDNLVEEMTESGE